MCGLIAGLLRQAVDPADIKRALHALDHRGPDGTGEWISEAGNWFLGHTRLSIIGLDNGTQPISNANNTLHVVVNGEFYGYQVIRDELRADGCAFATDSDSEIALHLYERRGMRAMESLKGEFAIVIADERQGVMAAIRDRFGIKPLFYAVIDGEVRFASEIKALLALGVPAQWDREAAYEDGFMMRDHERTLFKNIRSVPPGCYAIASDGDVRIYRYWDWDFPSEADLAADTRSEAEIVDGFRDVLTASVRDRLVADVEVGCYLSGGIDSCAVLGLAQMGMDRPINAYTLSFDDPMYDEAATAEAQARHVGANFHRIDVTRQNLADAYSDTVWHSETPMVNAHGAAKFLLSKAVHEAGLKVVFTGEGADEMLGGYPPFRRDAIMHHGDRTEEERAALIEEMFAANAATRAVFMRMGQDDPAFEGVLGRLGWLPSVIETYGHLGRIVTSMYADDLNAKMVSTNPFGGVLDRMPLSSAVTGRDRLNQALYINSKTHLANFILTFLGDRMEMAHSIEGRVPFLDHSVAEFAAGLPIDMKVRGIREKHVLREAAKDVLIEEVYDKGKHAFTAPPVTNDDKDPMMTLYEDVLSSKAVDEQSIFDPNRARSALGILKAVDGDQRIAFEGLIQRIVSVTLMQERFGMS